MYHHKSGSQTSELCRIARGLPEADDHWSHYGKPVSGGQFDSEFFANMLEVQMPKGFLIFRQSNKFPLFFVVRISCDFSTFAKSGNFRRKAVDLELSTVRLPRLENQVVSHRRLFQVPDRNGEVQWIGFSGKSYRKTRYLMGKSMVSSRCSLEAIL